MVKLVVAAKLVVAVSLIQVEEAPLAETNRGKMNLVMTFSWLKVISIAGSSFGSVLLL